MEFLQDNWIALISLAIALTGGIPGILAIVSHLTEKPKFKAEVSNFVTGMIEDNDTQQSILFIAVTVTNSGKKLLSPYRYDMRAQICGDWHELDRNIISNDFRLFSKTQNIDVEEPWKKDLQQFSRPLGENEYQHGFLYFLAPTISLKDLRDLSSIELELTCVDVFRNRHSCPLTIDAKPGREGKTLYPEHGMSITGLD